MVYKWISSTVISNKPNKGGLHLIPKVFGKLAINFIRNIEKFAATWRVTSSLHKASSFVFQINFRSLTNLGNIENSDESAIKQRNGICSEEAWENDVLNEVSKKNPNSIIIAYLNNDPV